MKKLMFAMVAGLCATVMADSLESANIVGFKQNTTVKGTTYQGTMFVSMGTGKMSDLKVVGNTEPVGTPMVEISKVNQYGVAADGINWIDFPDYDLYGWYVTDWESSFESKNDVPLSAGEALKVQIIEDAAVGWGLQSTGEVALNGVAVTLVKGTQYLAAAVPRASKLGEVIVGGYTGVVGTPMIEISTINQYGVAADGINWIDFPDYDLYGWYVTDWESSFEDKSNVPLTQGQGVKVQVIEDAAVGWTLTFAPAIPVAE